MIPALLAAKPLVKYGVMAGVIVAVVGGLFSWGYLKGRSDMKEKWDAAIAEQAAESNKEVMAQAESTNTVLEQHAQAEQRVRERVQIVDREVVRYVQQTTKPCVLDPQLVELFDAISRVPDDPERVPAADGSPGESVDPSSPGVSTDEVLQAYYSAVEQLTLLWVDYAALVQWERGRYIVEKAGFER
jgi:hypothetical protein